MDFNSVLQNTRQYFQGIPSSSPANGELTSGASVGYSSPPVSSSATSTATSATNPFPPYKQSFPQGFWNGSSSSSAAAIAAATAQNVAYRPPSSGSYAQPNATRVSSTDNNIPYPRNYSPAVTTPYHFYENPSRHPKTLPSTSTPGYTHQQSYTAPLITRTKEGADMYSMDSIVCQPNVNHFQNKKSKIKMSSLTTSPASSANVYKQPTQLEESRLYNNRLTALAQPPSRQSPSALTTVSKVPAVMSPHISTPTPPPPPSQIYQRHPEQPSANHQTQPSRSQLIEQRVGYHQASYQSSSHTVALRTASSEKVPQREPVQYNYRRVESAALETPTSLLKRDSPLDLSVKTIRQSADSTALDDPENSYGSHFPLTAHQTLRTEGRHPHLPQLPYVPVTAMPVIRNHSNPGAQNRQAQYANLPPTSYPETAYGLKNGQLQDELNRLPISQYRNEKMTVSITYEKKQRTRLNEQVSSMKYSSHYSHQLMAESKSKSSRPQHPLVVEQSNTSVSHVLPIETNHVPTSVTPKSPLTTSARKHKPISSETTPPIKNPRISQEWRENINKEIENRLNAYTSMMKAKEEEEKQLSLASRNNESYRSNVLPQHNNQSKEEKECVRSATFTSEKEQRDHYRSMGTPSQSGKLGSGYPLQQTHSPKLPYTQYLEQQQQQQKAQHKLPVQPIQTHHSQQQWYQNNVHPHPRTTPNLYSGSPYKPSIFQDTHTVQFSQSGYDNQNDLKVIEKIENPKIVNAEEQKPLPPFRALPLMNFSPQSSKSTPPPPSAVDRLQGDRGVDVKLERTSDTEFSTSRKDKDGQSKAALLASAKAHPRIRTKAELKQGTPVDKSKNKSRDVGKLPEDVQNFNKLSNRSQLDSENKNVPDAKGYISDSKLDVIDHAVYNHRPVSVNSIYEMENAITAVLAGSSSYVDIKQYSPKKKLFSKSEENGAGVKRSSSETTVFEFRDTDSEPETSSSDLHSLNEMRKDRKTRTPSLTPTNIDQLNEEPNNEDLQWKAACDELINQFSDGSIKKRGRRKKPLIEDSSHEEDECSPPKKKIVKDEKLEPEDEASENEDAALVAEQKCVIPAEKIKKEKVTEEARQISLIEKPSFKVARIKAEKTDEEIASETAKIDERRGKDVKVNYERKIREVTEREARRTEKQTQLELRGQRSNVGTTRIRIQNLLEDSSDTDDNAGEKFAAKKPKLPNKVTKVLKKKLSQKKKTKLIKKQKKNKVVASKKLKKVDVKREKMRHLILRRMETRKSKLDAMKSLRKSKPESSASSDDSQPIMTRKMARRECQKDGYRTDALRQRTTAMKTNNKMKVVEKEEKRTAAKDKIDKQERIEKDKVDKRDKGEPERTEKTDEKTKKILKYDKSKKNEKLKKLVRELRKDLKDKNDDVTRRSLRSRNVVVMNDKLGKKLKKKNLNNAKEKSKSPVKVKKESKNEIINDSKNGSKNEQKNSDKEKEKETEKEDAEKEEIKGSWEEELFKYKYSLRMPVKLINIARPTNWPKSNGGCSSLPDLDRNETDSDLLNEVDKQKTSKKKNKDETKFSNTKEFKDSVKYLKEKFDKKIEEKNQLESNLSKLMIENKIKIIPKSSDGPELLPTPSLDGFKPKFGTKTETMKIDDREGKDSYKNDAEDEDKDEVVEESLIGYFRKETVDVFKEVFEKHNKVRNQFKTVILESRTRTQTKEMKQDATLKRVFGLDRPASAPPIQESNNVELSSLQSQPSPLDDKKEITSPNGVHKKWKNFTKLKFLMGEEPAADSDADSKDFEDAIDYVACEEDAKDTMETECENVVKKKSRTIRRKCRSSGFDYIRKKKKQKKEDENEEPLEEKEKKKSVVSVRPSTESMEDIQNEIKSWVVNKGIGETVLHKAARLGYLDISSYCLEKQNCLPSPTDNAGYTPLHEACTRGHLKIAKMLLKYGADVSASARGGIRPLHEAVENGNVELVRLLLSYGADPLLSTYAGQTPLSLVKEDQDKLKEFLLLYLADIQGSPSKPWPFGGVDDFDREINGYDPLTEIPTSNYEELETLEVEISDSMLPNLYRFKDEYDYWVLCSDLPTKIRDHVTKSVQDQNPPPYIVRKINKMDFDENVECVMLLQNKYLQKSKSKCPLISMVKYTDKLISILSIQKLNLSFS